MEHEIVISERDINLILDALSYQHWNDRELCEEDRNRADGLFQVLEQLVEVTAE